MTYQGLRFEVRQFCGAPLISAEGHVDAWQFEMLRNLLGSFRRKGHGDVVVDFTRMQIGSRQSDSARALVDAVRTWHPDLNVHVIAAGDVARVLAGTTFPFRAHLCSSLDEAAEYMCKLRRMMDYRFDPSMERDYEADLPLAA